MASMIGSGISTFLHALVLLHEQAVQDNAGHARAVQGAQPARRRGPHLTRNFGHSILSEIDRRLRASALAALWATRGNETQLQRGTV